MRKDQTNDQKAMQNERLAVLALASQVASGTQPPVWQGPTLDGSWISPNTSKRAAISHAIAPYPDESFAMPVNTGVAKLSRGRRDASVLGPALPGLLLVNCAAELHKRYAQARDSTFKNDLYVCASDAIVAGLLVLTTIAIL